MSGPYFIELLQRNDEVRKRYPLPELPIKIGRAYDNDLILDDPYIAPHHAIIEQDEAGLRIRDVGSQNGIVHQKQKLRELTLDAEQVFRLGHSRLRLRHISSPVAPELPDQTNHNFEGWPAALPGLLMIVICTLAKLWLFSDKDGSLLSYTADLVGALALALGWVGLWSLANRLLDHHPRFGRHLFIAGCGYTAIALWLLLSNLFGYAFSLSALTAYSRPVFDLLMVATILFHIHQIKPFNPRRLRRTGLPLLLLVWGYNFMDVYQRSGGLSEELYMSQLLPPSWRWVSNQSPESFFDAAKALQEKADRARKKPAASNDDVPEG
jgi:hypothetical protein